MTSAKISPLVAFVIITIFDHNIRTHQSSIGYPNVPFQCIRHLSVSLCIEEVCVGLPEVLQPLVAHALRPAVQGEHRALSREAAEGAFRVYPRLKRAMFQANEFGDDEIN